MGFLQRLGDRLEGDPIDGTPDPAAVRALILANRTRCPHGAGESIDAAPACCATLRNLLIAGRFGDFHQQLLEEARQT